MAGKMENITFGQSVPHGCPGGCFIGQNGFSFEMLAYRGDFGVGIGQRANVFGKRFVNRQRSLGLGLLGDFAACCQRDGVGRVSTWS